MSKFITGTIVFVFMLYVCLIANITTEKNTKIDTYKAACQTTCQYKKFDIGEYNHIKKTCECFTLKEME